MFDTVVTIVGNVITAPEWRRTSQTNTLVAYFKVASNARRFDKESGKWTDGPSLRVRVNCWRRLAEGVAASVMVGDPVIVTGRMHTRDWTNDDGQRRSTYELEAAAVGHDLARGRGKFQRTRPTTATSMVEDPQADARVGGEPSTSVRELNDRYRSIAGAEEFEEDLGGSSDGEPVDSTGALPAGDLPSDAQQLSDAEPEAEPDDALGILRAAGLEPAPADLDTVLAGSAGAGEAAESVPADAVRSRRGRSRVPVAM
jgi:single-strand DNA-binding protein